MRGLLTAAAAALAFALAGPAGADDRYSFVSDEELAREAAAREADLERTRQRIAGLRAEIVRDSDRIEAARDELAKLDADLAQRAGLLYRLSRDGAVLRYLFGASSPTRLLRRIGTLRRLVIAGLERRRDRGRELAELEDRLATARADLEGARALAERLERARAELDAEQRRRREASPSLRLTRTAFTP